MNLPVILRWRFSLLDCLLRTNLSGAIWINLEVNSRSYPGDDGEV